MFFHWPHAAIQHRPRRMLTRRPCHPCDDAGVAHRLSAYLQHGIGKTTRIRCLRLARPTFRPDASIYLRWYWAVEAEAPSQILQCSLEVSWRAFVCQSRLHGAGDGSRRSLPPRSGSCVSGSGAPAAHRRSSCRVRWLEPRHWRGPIWRARQIQSSSWQISPFIYASRTTRSSAVIAIW